MKSKQNIHIFPLLFILLRNRVLYAQGKVEVINPKETNWDTFYKTTSVVMEFKCAKCVFVFKHFNDDFMADQLEPLEEELPVTSFYIKIL